MRTRERQPGKEKGSAPREAEEPELRGSNSERKKQWSHTSTWCQRPTDPRRRTGYPGRGNTVIAAQGKS